jgi:hypothetical protein
MNLTRYDGNPILLPHPDHPWEDVADGLVQEPA